VLGASKEQRLLASIAQRAFSERNSPTSIDKQQDRNGNSSVPPLDFDIRVDEPLGTQLSSQGAREW
jgi:hypothetical protein